MMCGYYKNFKIFLILIFCDYSCTKTDVAAANGGVIWTLVLPKYPFLTNIINSIINIISKKTLLKVMKNFEEF